MDGEIKRVNEGKFMLYDNGSKSGRENLIHRQLGSAFFEMETRKETDSTS
jgi:hypothetical protein